MDAGVVIEQADETHSTSAVVKALSEEALGCLARADDERAAPLARLQRKLTFARAADGEADAAGEKDEHEPIEREDRSGHPPKVAGEEEGANDERGTNSGREGECDEVAGAYVPPGSAVHSEAFECDDTQEYDVRKRLSEPIDFAGGDVKVKPQGKRGQVGNGCENEVGGDYDRAPVARRDRRNT